MDALKFGGNVVTLGMIPQPVPALNSYALLGKGLMIHGMPVDGRDGLQEVIAFIDALGLKPVIHQAFVFDNAKRAYEEHYAFRSFWKNRA